MQTLIFFLVKLCLYSLFAKLTFDCFQHVVKKSIIILKNPSKMSKRQRVDLTGEEKKTICEVHLQNPSLSRGALAEFMVKHHGYRLVDRTTISKILGQSRRWLQVQCDVHEGKIKRVKDVKFPQIEKALLVWYGQVKAMRGIVNDRMLSQKALEFRDAFGISEKDLKLSHGWLDKFKARHGIVCHNLYGEASDVDAHGVGVSQAKLPAIIATYDIEDVFNFDETGLYYRAPPSKTLNVGQPLGMEKKKDHITLGLCTNVSGKERMKMVFIHNSVRPRCFPKAFDPNMLVHYYFNAEAWMTQEIFSNWVMAENNLMAAKNRKILILLDTASSHTVHGVPKTMIGVFEAFVLSNITLLFFPANVTSMIQPLNQGVIAGLKLRYKRKLVASILEQCATTNITQDLGGAQVDLLQAMVWAVASWNELDQDTIRNAWRVCNILPWDWNANIGNLQERVKVQASEEISELEKLIGGLNLGNTEDGRSIEKLHASDYLDMVDENITEGKSSTLEVGHLVQSNDHMAIECHVASNDEHSSQDIECKATTDKNDMECKSVHLVEARVGAQKLLDFIIGEGSEIFSCSELLQVERICDKLSRMSVAHITDTKKSDIKSFMLHG